MFSYCNFCLTLRLHFRISLINTTEKKNFSANPLIQIHLSLRSNANLVSKFDFTSADFFIQLKFTKFATVYTKFNLRFFSSELTVSRVCEQRLHGTAETILAREMHLELEIWSAKPQNEKCINTHAEISFCLFSSKKKLAIAFWNEVFLLLCLSFI